MMFYSYSKIVIYIAVIYIVILPQTQNIKQKKYPPPVRKKGIFWSDVSVFLRPAIPVSVAVLPRLVVIIPLTKTIASVSGQKTTNMLYVVNIPYFRQ